MVTDTQLLQGEVVEDPEAQEQDVERLLAGFLRALIDEQRASAQEPQANSSSVSAPAAPLSPPEDLL